MRRLFPPKHLANSVCGAQQKWEGPPQQRPTFPPPARQPYTEALYFSIRQLSKWSGPLEVYKRPCLIKGNPPSPTAHTLLLFLFGLLSRCWRRAGGRGGGRPGGRGAAWWKSERSPSDRMLLFREEQMTRFLATEEGSAERWAVEGGWGRARSLCGCVPPAWGPPPLSRPP